MSLIVGITGNIGSGKTTFAHLLCTTEPSHALYETGELIAEAAEDFNRALSGELAFETAGSDTELTNQALIWFIESIAEKLHRDDVTWNQLALTKQLVATKPELYEKLFTYLALAKAQPHLLDQRITSENKSTYRPLLQWIGGYLVAKVSGTIWYDELLRRIRLYDSDTKLVIIGGVRYPSDAVCVRQEGGLIIAIERPGVAAETTDITELTRAQIEADIIVHNNGTMEQLQYLAETVYSDLAIGAPQSEYRAA